MKDPAFLFYPNDYLGGTMGMTFEQKGAYIELLMTQFNRGHMTEHMIGQILGQNAGQIWVIIKDKFIKDADGKYYNVRLEEEQNKRKAFTESRKNNLEGKNQFKKTSKKSGHKTKHMTNHMENENDNINEVEKEIYNNAVKIYFDFYEKKVGVKPAFSAAEGKNLKELLVKLRNSISQNGNKATIEESFTIMLNKLPKFYSEKLDIKIINSKYDGIIAEIRTKSAGQNDMSDILNRRQREREAAAKENNKY